MVSILVVVVVNIWMLVVVVSIAVMEEYQTWVVGKVDLLPFEVLCMCVCVYCLSLTNTVGEKSS